MGRWVKKKEGAEEKEEEKKKRVRKEKVRELKLLEKNRRHVERNISLRIGGSIRRRLALPQHLSGRGQGGAAQLSSAPTPAWREGGASLITGCKDYADAAERPASNSNPRPAVKNNLC